MLMAAGCSSGSIPTYPVEGIVTLPDGTPLAGAGIELSSSAPATKGVTARGQTDAAGRFRLTTFLNGVAHEGAVAGPHKVVVVPPAPPPGSPPNTPDHRDLVPVDYRNYDSSPIEFTVTPGAENRLTIPLPAH
jgi:hypothetical protein